MNFDKALQQAKAEAGNGERILLTAKATARQPDGKGKGDFAYAGALVLTERRLIFVGSLMLERRVFSVPLATILSVDSQRQAFVPYTVIVVQGGVSHRFYELPADMRAKIDELRFAPAASAPVQSYSTQTAPAASTGVADQLAKLADLHRSGVLTADEFTAAKARLLT